MRTIFEDLAEEIQRQIYTTQVYVIKKSKKNQLKIEQRSPNHSATTKIAASIQATPNAPNGDGANHPESFEAPRSSFLNPSATPFRPRSSSNGYTPPRPEPNPNTSLSPPKPVKRVFKWTLWLGNVAPNSKDKPVLIQTICSMKIYGKARKHSQISESSTDSALTSPPRPKADLQQYECSFNIWEKKAKERQQIKEGATKSGFTQKAPNEFPKLIESRKVIAPPNPKLSSTNDIPSLMDVCFADRILERLSRFNSYFTEDQEPTEEHEKNVISDQNANTLSIEVAEAVLKVTDDEKLEEEEKIVREDVQVPPPTPPPSPLPPTTNDVKIEASGDIVFDTKDEELGQELEEIQEEEKRSLDKDFSKMLMVPPIKINLYTKTVCITMLISLLCSFLTLFKTFF